MPQYRTKQVTFDAVTIPAVGADFNDPASDLTWILDAALTGTIHRTETGVSVTTADQSLMNGTPGDWLMRGSDGAIFICPSASFANLYEVAPAAAPAATS